MTVLLWVLLCTGALLAAGVLAWTLWSANAGRRLARRGRRLTRRLALALLLLLGVVLSIVSTGCD